ncbi:MAG: LysM peptidoglycan-binding domain-containing protein [Rhodoferax sp.]|uniref:LysM peptidoglycan-binding domain-containing protein n=1 Tax=Rhodoferax sp. TaxID=50421 RepID=UPI002728F4E2|nr:LysM peptidoglycan-binding domain-containing protein [Rhodoferax sp.]MDO8450326.1 LysM peptidoglycan-binding domain-containing protein [Rhodoferax sp.]
MTSKSSNPTMRRNPPPVLHDEQPLLRILVAQATRRGDTLARLAKELGVTYERLAQWRRNEAAISSANRAVHESAARYLGLPTVLVLTLAGTVAAQDFIWPGKGSLQERVGLELARLRRDPFLGAFVPAELLTAGPAVQLFVAFLYRELDGDDAHRESNCRWLTALHRAAVGDATAQAELDTLRNQAAERASIF